MKYVALKFEFPTIEKKIKRICNVFDTFNVPYTFNVISERIAEVNVDYGTKVIPALYSVVDFEFESDNMFVDGCEILATIEKTNDENENLVYPVHDNFNTIPYRTSVLMCEHCKTKHNRKKCVVIRDVDGTEKILGRACLKKYLSVNAETLLSAFEQIRTLFVDTTISDHVVEKRIANAKRCFPTKTYLAYCIKRINEGGYNKAVKDYAFNDMCQGKQIEERYIREADNIIEYYKKLDKTNLNDFENNVRVTIDAKPYIDTENGFIAYAYVLYLRMVEKTKNTANEEVSASNHIGTVGQRIEFTAEIKLVYSYSTAYGLVNIYEITDENENKFVWKTTVDIMEFDEHGQIITPSGKKFTVKGTIKAHTEFRGIKQTELTRCKVKEI